MYATLPLLSSSFHLNLTTPPTEIKSRKDSSSSSLSGSSTANQAAASTSQVAGPMETVFLMERGEVLQMDWVNGGLPSGAYFFSVLTATVIYHCRRYHRTFSVCQQLEGPPGPPFPPPHQMGCAMHHTPLTRSRPSSILLQLEYPCLTIRTLHCLYHQMMQLLYYLTSTTSLLPSWVP